MALLLRSGAVFLHVPKTGGTWVTEVLRELGLLRCRFSHKHADMHHVLESPRLYRYQHWKRCLSIGPSWHSPIRDAFKFCFVRHPLDWYESWWRYMSMNGWPNFAPVRRNGRREWHPTAELEDLRNDSLPDFLWNIADQKPGFASRMFASYVTPQIGFVGKQERLVDDLISVLKYLNESFDEQRIREFAPINKSRFDNSKRTWSVELEQKLAHQDRESFRRFGYADSILDQAG